MNESAFIVTVKLRNYKCTPRMISAYANEWVGKELAEVIPSNDAVTFEFTKKEYAACFENAISRYKI